MSREEAEGAAEGALTITNTTVRGNAHMGNTYSMCLIHARSSPRGRSPCLWGAR